MPAVRSFRIVICPVKALRWSILVLFAGQLNPAAHGQTAQAADQKQAVSLPIAFEENRGQFDDRTRFLVRNASGTVHFLESGPEFVLGRAKDQVRVELQPEVSPKGTRLAAEEVMPGKVNYFLGNEKSARYEGIPTYGRVRYRNFMYGVDLTFYGTQHGLEHDFIVAPGVSPASVRFRMKGADSVQLRDTGELSIHTTTSEMLFRKPVAYQVADGKRTNVDVDFVLNQGDTISFRVGQYDKRSELVIDPVLVFSTYLDGTHADTPTSIVTDSSGDIYVGGYTTSPDFPVANSYQSTCGLCFDGGFGESGYIAKLDPTGSTLLYSTYFIGNGQTDISRIKIDGLGNIVGTGYTASTNFPRIGNYSGSYANGTFVFSLNPAGTTLNHSEIIGIGPQVSGGYGALFNNPYNLVVDSDSNVYVTGVLSTNPSFPPNIPITPGTYGIGKTGTLSNEIFIAKVTSNGSLVYSTIVPSTSASNFSVAIGGLAVDPAGNVYVSGTAGSGLPTTANSISPAFPNGTPVNVAYSGLAGFVLALDPTASQLLFSTYLPGTDNANTLSLAADGSLYVAGTTSETTLPVSANAFQPALKQGAGCICDGGYVLRLNATGTQVLNATYLSGTNDYNNTLTEYGSSAFDSAGNIYLGGIVYSTDFPMANPVVSFFDITGNTWAGGTVLAGLSPDLTKLVFGSYFSGDGAGDRVADMTISSNDRMVLTGGTFSDTNFPTTGQAFQPKAPARVSQGVGYSHQFVASIDLTTPAPSVCLSPRSVTFGSVTAGSVGNATVTLTNCGNAPLTVASMTSTSGLVSITPATVSLAPGKSTPLQVQYAPVDATAVNGSVTVTSNATVPTERFFFTGQGVAPKLTAASSLELAQMVLGAIPATSGGLLVQNTGNAPLTISSVSITGPFTQTNSCIHTFAAKGLCSVSIQSTPTSVGAQQGTLTLTSNDPANPQTTVALTGSVIASFTAPVLTSISEQTQVTGATNATLTLTGSNFFPQSIVRANGKATTSTFGSGSSLRITFDPTTISTIGEIPITVFNPTPGGGESAPLYLTLYQSITNAGATMISVPATGMLYAASNSGSTTTPNTVVAINPATGVVGTPISVGKDPAFLAASSDGAYLFVANRTDFTVQRIVTATNTVDRTFPYAPDVFCPTCSPPAVTGIQGVPGSPTSFVLAQGTYLSLYNDAGLVNELSTPTYGSLATYYPAFSGNPTHLYSYPFSATDNFFKQFTVDGTGVHVLATTGTASASTNESDFSIKAAGTQIYTSSGNVWDSTTKQLLGTIPLSIYNYTSAPSVEISVDPTSTRVYYGGPQTEGLLVTAYDTKTLSSQASLNFGNQAGVYITDLMRWGTDGFSFLNGTSLVLFRSSVLAGTTPLAPSLALTVADHAYGDTSFSVNATSNSPGAVTYSVVSGPATLSGNMVTITGAGQVKLQVVQASTSGYTTATQVATFQVAPAVLTIKANDATRSYGATNPAFSGSVSGAVNGDSFTESFATNATASSSAGTYGVVPSIAGTNAGNYTVSATNGTLTITQVGASISLSAGSGSVATGQMATFTVTVTSSTSGLPTGAATIRDGSTVLGTITLSNGSGTYTGALTGGFTHHFSATYSGDTNFTSAATTGDVVVAVTGADTSITSNTSSQQVAPGGTAVYALQLTPGVGNYPAPVTFSVQGLPNGFTASFSPPTVTLGSSAQTMQVTLQAPATRAQVLPGFRRDPRWPVVIAFVLLPLTGLRRGLRVSWRVFGALCLALVLVGGCSSGSQGSTQPTTPTQPTAYNVSITALSGAVQHQTTVILLW